MKKVIITCLIVVCIFSAISVSSAAANQYYQFYLSNTGRKYNVYEEHNNTKIIKYDKGTVNTSYNNAPGWGMAFCLKYKYYQNGSYNWVTATITSPGLWISGADTKYLTYVNANDSYLRPHYVAARIDDDYSGYYYCEGVFNADKTNP